METLVIGIDGGDETVLSAMELPFLSEFFEQYGTLPVEEDLWNRGWASILSGKHGRTTGGFYEKPKLDGTHDFEQSFGTRDYEQNEEITPLWERINDAGLSVGFMNVRTTMPAPSVDGFFVSGAGGGFKPSDGVPDIACFPRSIHEELSQSDYMWETRFLDSGVKNVYEYLELVTETVTQRAEAYLRLCREFDPDFGFVAQTETVGIQNLAMAEIHPMIENPNRERTELQLAIQEFYQVVDETIEQMVQELDPERIVIVSDHGGVPYKHSINADAFLQRIGMQPQVGGAEQKSRSAIRRVGEIAPSPVVNLVSSTVPSLRDKATHPDTDWKHTKAFGHRYVPGIYVNDERFSGPVRDHEYNDTLEKIIATFNDSEEAERYGLEASPYRPQYADAPQHDLLPDIWIDKPETLFFEGEGEFVEKNENYRSIGDQDLEIVDRNMHTGKKGPRPLLSFNFDSSLEESNEARDLSVANKIILESVMHI